MSTTRLKEPRTLAELFASWGPPRIVNPNEPRAFTKLASRYAELLQLIHRHEADLQARAEVPPRDAVLEEAAKACDAVRTKLITDDADYGAFTCAAAIRTLKSKPSAVSETATKDAEDAERYRWLRAKTNCRHGTTFQFPDISTLPRHYEPNTYIARFDACIDLAMENEAYQDFLANQGRVGEPGKLDI